MGVLLKDERVESLSRVTPLSTHAQVWRREIRTAGSFHVYSKVKKPGEVNLGIIGGAPTRETKYALEYFFTYRG